MTTTSARSDQDRDQTDNPVIRSLASRTANKDARFALQTNLGVIIASLPNGSWAICDQTRAFYLEVAELPDHDGLIALRTALNLAAMTPTREAHFYGEPTDREWTRDQRGAQAAQRSQATRPFRPAVEGLDL